MKQKREKATSGSTGTRRRQFLTTVGGAGVAAMAGCLGDGGDGSAEFPSEPITVVVPFGAGGGTDSQYRPFDEFFEDELGVSTQVDNRSGASGRLGWNHLYEQDGDGYTVGVISVATAVLNEALHDVAYTMDDMTTIGTTSVAYYGMVAEPGRFQDFDDFIEYAQGNEVTLASVGSGSTNHFGIVSVLDEIGASDRTEVPYDSGAEAAAAAGSGDVDLANANLSGIGGLVENEQVDLLFINSPNQIDDFPDVPTHADYDFSVPPIGLEVGMFGPPGIPDDRVSVLESALVTVTTSDEYIETARNQGFEVAGKNAAQTRELVDQMVELSDDYVELVEG